MEDGAISRQSEREKQNISRYRKGNGRTVGINKYAPPGGQKAEPGRYIPGRKDGQ